MSSFVQTLPTSSEGRTALKTNEAKISSYKNSRARSDCSTTTATTTRQHEDFEMSSTTVRKIVGLVVPQS